MGSGVSNEDFGVLNIDRRTATPLHARVCASVANWQLSQRYTGQRPKAKSVRKAVHPANRGHPAREAQQKRPGLLA